MTEEEFEKKVKDTKIFCIIIGILFVIGIFSGISQQNIATTVMSIGFIILLYLFYSLSKKKKMIGPIIGILLGTLYILRLNILTIIMGICILVDCISMIKYIKEIKQEEVSSKKIAISIIAIVVIGILVLLGNLGMKIMDSAKQTIDNKTSDNISNNTADYSYNGITIKYGDDWKKEYVGIGQETYIALCERAGDIVMVCLEVVDMDDGITDYSLKNKRQELYDQLIDFEAAIYSEQGITINKQTNEFKKLSNNLYYAYHEIYGNDGYVRSYKILNSTNSTVAALLVTSDSPLTDLEERNINQMMKTIKF